VDFGVAGGAGWNMNVNAVQGTTKLDGDPGGGRLGGHGKREEYQGRM